MQKLLELYGPTDLNRIALVALKKREYQKYDILQLLDILNK